MEQMKNKRRRTVCRVVYLSALVLGAGCTVAVYALSREMIRILVEAAPALVRWLMGALGMAVAAAMLADWVGKLI